jgi:hypothetical protein
MDIGILLGLFIQWPFLGLAPAGLFIVLYLQRRRPVLLIAGLAWLAYVPYELSMKLRILCSGECNIRIDLLLIYPLLALLSLSAILVWAWTRNRVTQQ